MEAAQMKHGRADERPFARKPEKGCVGVKRGDGATGGVTHHVWRRMLPEAWRERSCRLLHESIVKERTKLICTPRERCCPEHSRHTKVPWHSDAH